MNHHYRPPQSSPAPHYSQRSGRDPSLLVAAASALRVLRVRLRLPLKSWPLVLWDPQPHYIEAVPELLVALPRLAPRVDGLNVASAWGEDGPPPAVDYLGHAKQRFVHVRNLRSDLQRSVLISICAEVFLTPVLDDVSVCHLVPTVGVRFLSLIHI